MLGGTILGFPWTNSQKPFFTSIWRKTLKSKRRNWNPKIDLIYALLITTVFIIQLNLIFNISINQYFPLGIESLKQSRNKKVQKLWFLHKKWTMTRNQVFIYSWYSAISTETKKLVALTLTTFFGPNYRNSNASNFRVWILMCELDPV